MAEGALVAEKIEAGRSLVEAADSAGVPLRAALWLYDSGENTWALVLEADPSAGLGLREFSQRLHHAVSNIADENKRKSAADLLIEDVALYIRAHPVTEVLRPSLGHTRSVVLSRLKNTAVGGYVVDGAVLYRLERSQAV